MLVQPPEKKRVEGFGEVIPIIGCTIGVEEDRAQLLLDELCLVRQCRLQRRRLHTEELGHYFQQFRVANDSGIFIAAPVDRELEVSEVQDRSNELASLRYVPLRKPDGLQRHFQLIKSHLIVITTTIWPPHSSTLPKVPVSGLVQQM